MIKLISSDMDGTLLDSYRQITPINVEAIKRAQENGINFIINTGREYPNARGLVEAAGLKCDLICSNGACAFDKDGNLLFEHILDKKLSAPFLMHLINTEWNLHYLQQKDVFLFFH